MATSKINAIIGRDIYKVWGIMLAIVKYSTWRSDLSKTETVNDKQFVEYTKEGYATTFTVTMVEPYKRWEFDMENSNMKGHWTGIFTSKGTETQIDFTENVIPKKWFTAHGRGINLGYFGKEENHLIAEKLKNVFAEWIDNGHNNFDDKNTIILCVELTDGLLLSYGTKYEF